MTDAEIETEKQYRYLESLGNLCGSGEPTKEQITIARREAIEWESRYYTSLEQAK